jgi:hypothetical protein
VVAAKGLDAGAVAEPAQCEKCLVVALASLIGLATLVACDVPVDATSFVQEITRLLKP